MTDTDNLSADVVRAIISDRNRLQRLNGELLDVVEEIIEITKRQQLPLTAQINELARAIIAKAKELHQ